MDLEYTMSCASDIDSRVCGPPACGIPTEPSDHALGAFLGKGRSAVVYKCQRNGVDAARKIFCGTDLTNLILTLFYGAPVDYMWSPDAIAAAFHRRKVLKGLLTFWFGNDLTIADSLGTGTHHATNQQYMDTEFVAGRAAALYNPFSAVGLTEFKDLKYKILPKLQQQLMEAGLHGTVWQAGYGQPCAIANFLYSEQLARWVWIDAESGVPAIVSYSPGKLFGYYIPRAFKFGRVMFDSVDVDAFRAYLSRNESALKEFLSAEEYSVFAEHCERLIECSTRWQNISRTERSQQYFLFAGKISDEQRSYYRERKFRWAFYVAGEFIGKEMPKLFIHLMKKVGSYCVKANPAKIIKFCFNSLISSNYRIEAAHNHIERKINAWRDRGRLTEKQAQTLQEELDDNSARTYLSDFGIFLLFKPLGYLIRILLPVLVGIGLIDTTIAAFLFVSISIILRTSYAFFRCCKDFLTGKTISWVALVVAPIPMVGTLAYPCQMLHSARRGHSISQFIIYEIFSSISSKIPIFGGYESEIEYQLNRLGFKLVMAVSESEKK